MLSLLEALGSKLPTQKHQTHLERGSRMQGWVCICWDQEQLILTPDPDPALAHLLRLHYPTSLPTQSPGECHKSAIPTFVSSYFTELQEGKLTRRFPHRNSNTWGLSCGSKRKKPAGSSKLKLSFGLRPGAHPTLSGHRNSQLLAVFGVKAELSHN